MESDFDEVLVVAFAVDALERRTSPGDSALASVVSVKARSDMTKTSAICFFILFPWLIGLKVLG